VIYYEAAPTAQTDREILVNPLLQTVKKFLSLLLVANSTFAAWGQSDGSTGTKPQKGEMAGYLLVPHSKVSQDFNAGFSMYVAAWPLLKNYPGQEFQSGLFGTWMFAQFPEPAPKNHYSDIEGGLGWWRDTRFATETPKFIMGGVALNFREWANGPGAGKGRDWNKPAGHYAIAQLSPRLLWPPDGLNLKQGTCGELFGYGYLPLPLTDPKKTTEGKEIPTGNQLVPACSGKARIGRHVPRYIAFESQQSDSDGDPAYPCLFVAGCARYYLCKGSTYMVSCWPRRCGIDPSR
jgi:hypothetical protein